MKCAIVDERISGKCERGLLLHGFRVIKMPAAHNLGEAVKSHPDMLMFKHKSRIITSAEYCEKFPYPFVDIREFSPDIEFTFADCVFEKEYPRDAVFNALTVGNSIFLKADTVCRAIIEYAQKEGLTLYTVKQGYPACTTLAFANCAITADGGMAKILKSAGVDVTLISDGDISLPPYEYGFIGGAAGVYGNTVYFLGNPERHRDKDKILTAIENAGFSFVALSDEPLRDLGRIIFTD